MADDVTHTWRLTFAYDGEDVRLARAQRVEMRAPPVVTAPPQPGAGGFWLEVRDAQDRLIYHRPLHNPLRRHIEFFGEKSGDAMRQLNPDAQRGEFDMLVPDLPDGAQFSVHGAAVTPTAADPDPVRRRMAAPSVTAAPAAPADTALARGSFDDLRKNQK